MSLIFKLTAVVLLHLAFFACYPETGRSGNYYLAVSLLLWTVFMLTLNTGAKLVKLISGVAGLAVNLAAFALLALAVAATMPQSDNTSVLKKIQSGRYPDRATITTGLLRFGIDLKKETAAGIKTLNKEFDKAAEKLKTD